MKNKLVALIGMAGSLLLSSATAQAAGLELAGTTDVYAQAVAQNFGVGVGGEHWFSNNIGIGGGISGGQDYQVLNVRALFLLDTDFKIVDSPAQPFGSAGLALVQGPSYSFAGMTSQSTGAGPEISGGVQWQTPWVKNLYLRPELIVHLFKVKTTINNVVFDSGYNGLDLMFSAAYRF
jgi:hypothetical protein